MERKGRLGIIGLGHLGKIHLNCALASGVWDVVGCFDTDFESARNTLNHYRDIPLFPSLKSLLNVCEAVVVVTPTPSHFAIAQRALRAGCHVFIEKPITQTVAEARKIVALAHQTGKVVQIGHVERFNPAFLALKDVVVRPSFVEIHRLAMYQPRGTDVSVVLDLMIHDLDLVLHLMGKEIKSIDASGVSLLSTTADIANVRLVMKSGAVVNLTASRISLKQMRKVRIFQPDAYISMDFLEKKAQIVRIFDAEQSAQGMAVMPLTTAHGTRYVGMIEPEVQPVNAILEELKCFYTSIITGSQPIVTAEDGLAALHLAHRIIRKMNSASLRQ